jgi:hypothetical protein
MHLKRTSVKVEWINMVKDQKEEPNTEWIFGMIFGGRGYEI